jgi:mannose-6-phosphate isomerase-like protein (cupin superfamily)
MTRLLFLILAFMSAAQPTQVVDLYTVHDLNAIEGQLAKGSPHFASRDLHKYGNHYTMMAYRNATGSSEIHEHEADIFFIQEGDAVIVTGGKMIGGHLTKPGELRGTFIEGGEKRPLKTGDIIHIPAGIAHQILITPGKPIAYFVVKVKGQ